MLTSTTEASPTWVPLATAKRRLAASRATILGLIRAGRLSVLRVPGARPKLRLDEIERLAEESTRVATPNTV